MPVTTDTLLLVVLGLIALNFFLGLGLLVVPRLRGGRSRGADELAPVRPPARAAGEGVDRFERRPVGASFAASGGAGVGSDHETGLELPGTWARWLKEEDARIRRYRRPGTVVLVDIDGLDRLVDRLGTAAAEKLIPPVAATMRRQAREADRIARLGPARFGAILPETDEIAAINYVERVRATCDLWLAAGAVSLRLVIGWAEVNPNRSVALALQAAEERLNAERHRDVGAPEAPAQPVDSSLTNASPAT